MREYTAKVITEMREDTRKYIAEQNEEMREFTAEILMKLDENANKRHQEVMKVLR
jgi:vacuolar-type H+-ATPase subunit H